jgi:hypothetical protein
MMFAWLVEKWDWWIYGRACHSLCRMCERSGADYAYLMELWLREWRNNHLLTPEVENATERFFEALRGQNADQKALNQVREPCYTFSSLEWVSGLANRFERAICDLAISIAEQDGGGDVTVEMMQDAARSVIESAPGYWE